MPHDSTLTARIEDLSPNGDSVARSESGKVVFLDRGLPGERVEYYRTSKSRKFDRGRVIEIVENSPKRISAECGHFANCGGCAWQDLEYTSQVEFKRKMVIDNLERIGKLEDVAVDEVVSAPERFYYRNKMEFSFNRNEEESGFNLGLHVRGRYRDVFDVTDCRLQSQRSNEILTWVRDFCQRYEVPAYDVKEHTGFARFVMIREGKNTGELMINFVTTTESFGHSQDFVDECTSHFPEVTTIIHSMNDRRSNVAYGDDEVVLYGPGYIHETTLSKKFRVYANSFLQTNTHQTEALYSLAIERAEFRSTDTLFDLYCGAGTIGICASEKVEKIVGIELEPSAIRAAEENADLNGVHNASWFSGGVRETLRERESDLGKVDIMIIDPPRAGMHPRAVYHAARYRPRRIVYISCNPGAFSRDAALFAIEGYRILRVTPVDMFPHTTHIELVAVLESIA